MGKYFGTDGFRGEANVVLTVEHAFKVGRYLGWYFGQEHKARIVIGKDTRRSSYMFEYALAAGLTASGADAYLLHVTTTPSVSYVVRTEDFDCGIMISASHNPYYDNGIKVINRMGHKMEAEVEEKIESYIDGEIGELYRNYEDMRLRLKESTDEKILAEKQNKELVSNISHDLKTPITAIKGYVEGIMDGVADTPEKIDKYIKTIYNKANDMDRLINELTVYSGIDSNRIPYHFHKINVSEYFGDCIEEVGLDLESKNIALNYSSLISPDTLIIADPEQMKRVINNIIGNSVKYMDKEKGEIDIRILDEIDSVRVEIEDNGKGIVARDLPNIFERFFRTDASRNSAQGGSGIGLSIVKKIIEDHGGYIWATSREGEGTCMHFVIRKYQETQD